MSSMNGNANAFFANFPSHSVAFPQFIAKILIMSGRILLFHFIDAITLPALNGRAVKVQYCGLVTS